MLLLPPRDGDKGVIGDNGATGDNRTGEPLAPLDPVPGLGVLPSLVGLERDTAADIPSPLQPPLAPTGTDSPLFSSPSFTADKPSDRFRGLLDKQSGTVSTVAYQNWIIIVCGLYLSLDALQIGYMRLVLWEVTAYFSGSGL